MRRFIHPSMRAGEDKITITGDLFRHMTAVLRLKNGTRIILADGRGGEYEGVITQVEGRSITVSLENDSSLPTTEPGPKITLYQGIPKGDKLDLILQKCTELGATEIIPFIAARSVARVPEARIQERVERWRRIVLEAARQSNRFSVPEVFFAGDLANVLQLAKHSVKLLLWEEEQVGALRKTLAGFSSPLSIAVIVGPEGGLTVEEVESAGRCGFIPVSLGKRILRTETAALVVLSILQFYWGDIG